MLVKGRVDKPPLSADDLSVLDQSAKQDIMLLLLQDIRGLLLNIRENTEKVLSGDGYAGESTLDATDYDTLWIEP